MTKMGRSSAVKDALRAGTVGGGAPAAQNLPDASVGDGLLVSGGVLAVDSTVARDTWAVSAGAGLSGGGTLSASGIALSLASSAAGNGLTHAAGVLAVGAGNGITVATDDVRVDQGYAFTWTAGHTFQATATMRNVQPEATDTYDLGSSTKLWRKGWLAELDAVLFSQNTASVIGGWLIISKGEGALPSTVNSGDTTIDFGQAMTVNDFVLFRASGQVEYVQVGALVSGTTYNVTRNLDGSGANTWVGGTVYVVLGNNGNGRIELNAQDTPRLSIIKQGATYNAQTEVFRAGDLNGAYGIGAEAYGLGVGDYSAGNFMRYDPANGFKLQAGNGAVDLTSSGIRMNVTTGGWTGADIRWATGGTQRGYIVSSFDGVLWGLDLYGPGAATVRVESSTVRVEGGSLAVAGDMSANNITANKLAATVDGNTGGLYAGSGSDVQLYRSASNMWRTPDGLTVDAGMNIGSASSAATGEARASVGFAARVDGSGGGFYAGAGSDVQLYRNAASVWRSPHSLVMDTGLNVGSYTSPSNGDIRASGGIYLGRDADPGNGNVAYAGDLKAYRGSTEYTGYIYVPITPVNLTDTSANVWSAFNAATGTYTFDLQAVANGLPANIKAVKILLTGQWAAAAGTSNAVARPRGGSVNHLVVRAMVANINIDHQGDVAVDGTNFDIDVVVSGATMNSATCRCVGYYI